LGHPQFGGIGDLAGEAPGTLEAEYGSGGIPRGGAYGRVDLGIVADNDVQVPGFAVAGLDNASVELPNEGIGEAVTTSRARAYRAAIMSAWVAVAYDIITKIRELASQGDAAAKAVQKELADAIEAQVKGDEAAIARLQKIERGLLEQSLNVFEFLSPQEYNDLVRLKEDRNLCAHPAFTRGDLLFQPGPELVRTHIVHAVRHLLQHPPVQGKAALARLKADLLQPSFPTDQTGVSEFLEHKYLNRLKDALLNNFIAVFLKILVKDTEPDLRGKEESVLRCLAAVRDRAPSRYDDTIAAELPRVVEGITDPHLVRILRLFKMDRRVWDWIGRPLQLRLISLARNYRYDDGPSDFLFDGLVIEELRRELMAAFTALEEDEKVRLIARSPHVEFADQAIAIYEAVGNYRSAEAIAGTAILPLSEHFTPEHIRRIITAVVTNGEIRGAFGSPEQIRDLFLQSSRTRAATAANWQELMRQMEEEGWEFAGLRQAMIDAGLWKMPERS
jgi:hypothetical protein